MLNKTLTTLVLATAFTGAAFAQAASPAKKELVARILKAQQAGIENMARSLAMEPAMAIADSAERALPVRVPKERQDAVTKEIQADLQKYVDETVPLVVQRAISLAPSTAGAVLETEFTEDELRTITGMLESPAFAKFQQVSDKLQKALGEKLITETRGTVEPRVKALEQTVGRRLGIEPGQASPAAPAPRAPASRAPAKK